MNEQKIEPCPFCGKEVDCTPDIDGTPNDSNDAWWSVYCCTCEGCSGCGYNSKLCATWKEAIVAHNRASRAVQVTDAFRNSNESDRDLLKRISYLIDGQKGDADD